MCLITYSSRYCLHFNASAIIHYVFQVDKLLKESCDTNGEYCQFHQRFVDFLKTLPSKNGFNDFSIFKSGSLNQKVKIDWIKNAIWSIFGDSSKKILDGTPSVTTFFEKLENYNFPEFFQNETNNEDNNAAESPDSNSDGNDEDKIDIQDLYTKIQRFHSIMKKYSDKTSIKKRKKRADVEWLRALKGCDLINSYAHFSTFALFYDGPVISLGSIIGNELPTVGLEEESLNLLDEAIDEVTEFCPGAFMTQEELRMKLEELRVFLDIKEFDDGMTDRAENPSVCKVPSENTTNRCLCECHKTDKLAIYGIYASIKLVEKEINISRFGDLYTFYYYNTFQQYYDDVSAPNVDDDPVAGYPKVDSLIGDEIKAFEKNVLADLIGSDDFEMGLTDFISLMSQPPWIWTQPYDFPRMYSLKSETRKEIQDVFKYDNSVFYSEDLNLKLPDFGKLSMSSICENENNFNFTDYCQLTNSLPDLQTIMHMMSLAKFPNTFENKNVRNMIRKFTKSEEPLPKASYLPTCYFGKKATEFWESRDYEANDLPSSKVEYDEDMSKETADLYKYSKCKDFTPKPTDSGLCFTFNGLQVNEILKQSNWLSSFTNAFPQSENSQILMSEGIDKDKGFVFSLGIILSKYDFWQKSHLSVAGEILKNQCNKNVDNYT